MRLVLEIDGAPGTFPVQNAEIQRRILPSAMFTFRLRKISPTAFLRDCIAGGVACCEVGGIRRGAHNANDAAFMVKDGVCAPLGDSKVLFNSGKA